MSQEEFGLNPEKVERLSESILPLRVRRSIPLPPGIENAVDLQIGDQEEVRLITERTSPFRMIAYKDIINGKEHLAVIKGIGDGTDVPIRVHSSCLTAETFHASTCDCQEQLDEALVHADEAGLGGVIWLNQEGNDNGLGPKLAQIEHERLTGTFESVEYKGELFADNRTYEAAASILRDLGIKSVWLITNNPDKIDGLRALGIDVTGRIPSIVNMGATIATSYLHARRAETNYLGGQES